MSEPFHVLFVCTGNLCRSRAGEALLAARLRARLPPHQAGRLAVTSAGTQAPVGAPFHELTARAVGELGLVTDPGAARRLTADLVVTADLVLAATREHRGAAVTLAPRALSRSFTLAEFARLSRAALEQGDAAPGEDSATDDPADRARRLVAAASSLRGVIRPPRPEDDDVADPIGRAYPVHVDVVRQIDAATEVVAAALVGAPLPAPLPTAVDVRRAEPRAGWTARLRRLRGPS